MHEQLLRYGLVLCLALPAPAIALAADSGGSSSVNECAKGKAWDSAQQKCVDKTSLNEHDATYETGRELAKAGRFGEAIMVLASIADAADPRVFSTLGYSHRMQGRIEVGLGYYEEALRLDPDFAPAREYMGEAYLQKGDVDGARRQLSEIGKRCGSGCAEYVELERRIDAHLKDA